jgi:hypothetical protein
MTFSEQFKEVFELICEKIGVVIDWSQENVIPYVMDFFKRYVAYNIVETVLWILFSFALIVGVVIFFKVIFKDRAKCESKKKSTTFWDYYSYNKDIDPGFGAVFGFVFGSVFLIFGIVAFCFGVSELLKWCFVPEFQIVEKISYLISTM